LKQNLAKTRQELSTALYQHDAAVRVIARLTRERDEARDALSKVSVGARPVASNGDAMQVDSTALPDAIIAKVEATQEKLSKTRRKRPVPEDWATAEDISSYAPLESSEPLYPGGKSLAIDESGDLALLGGSDGIVGVYSLSQKKVLQALKGSGGAITDAAWAGSKAVVATSNGSVKIFEGGADVAAFAVHAGEATAVAVHPSGEIVASVGADKSYVLYDLSSSAMVTQIFSDSSLTSVQFHPDGHLLAAGGADGQIKIFDVKSGTIAATFESADPIAALYFSENGTWLASVSKGSSSVAIWDLRKSATIKLLDVGGRVDCVSWDYTGQFLLAGGPSGVTVQHYSKASKEWSEPLRSAIPAVAVAWGKAAQSAVAVDEQGVVTVLGSKS